MPTLLEEVADWEEAALTPEDDDDSEEENEEEAAEEMVEEAVAEAMEELKADLLVETTCGKVASMYSSEAEFYNVTEGMNRSYSGRSSTVTPRNSMMFDEEDKGKRDFDVCHSGEMRFANSDHANQSQTSIAEVDKKLQEGGSGEWSPRGVAGVHSPDRVEHFPGLTGHPSDVQRFSEEEGDGDFVCGDTMGGASSCAGQSEGGEWDSEAACEAACKMQALMEAGFPPWLLGMGGMGWGWGGMGWPGMPMFQPGVPITKLRPGEGCPHAGDEKPCPMKQAGICQDDGEGCVCNQGKDGRMMFYVEQSGSEEQESDEVSGAASTHRSTAAADSASKHASLKTGGVATSMTDGDTTISEQSSMSCLLSKLRKCGDLTSEAGSALSSQGANLLDRVKQKKALYEVAIEKTMPLKDTLVQFFIQGVIDGGPIDSAKLKYEEAYNQMIACKKDYRDELEALGININDGTKLHSVETMIKEFRPPTPPPVIAGPMCGESPHLERLTQGMEYLKENLPFKEINQLREFVKKSKTRRKSIVKQQEEQTDMAEVNAEGEFKKEEENVEEEKKKSKEFCYPFCNVTCKKGVGIEPKKKCTKATRKQLIEKLTKNLLKGPKQVIPGSTRADTKGYKQKKIKRLDIIDPISMPVYTPIDGAIKKRCVLASKTDKSGKERDMAEGCDMRKDFKESVGMHQFAALFPLMAKFGLGGRAKPVKPIELFQAVKRSGLKTLKFTMSDATKLCVEWKKGRKVMFDEVLFGVQNPDEYLRMVRAHQFKEIANAVEGWDNVRLKPKIDPFQKPRCIHDLPKPSQGIHIEPSDTKLRKHLQAIQLETKNADAIAETFMQMNKAFGVAAYARGKHDSPYAPNKAMPEMTNIARNYDEVSGKGRKPKKASPPPQRPVLQRRINDSGRVNKLQSQQQRGSNEARKQENLEEKMKAHVAASPPKPKMAWEEPSSGSFNEIDRNATSSPNSSATENLPPLSPPTSHNRRTKRFTKQAPSSMGGRQAWSSPQPIADCNQQRIARRLAEKQRKVAETEPRIVRNYLPKTVVEKKKPLAQRKTPQAVAVEKKQPKPPTTVRKASGVGRPYPPDIESDLDGLKPKQINPGPRRAYQLEPWRYKVSYIKEMS